MISLRPHEAKVWSQQAGGGQMRREGTSLVLAANLASMHPATGSCWAGAGRQNTHTDNLDLVLDLNTGYLVLCKLSSAWLDHGGDEMR